MLRGGSPLAEKLAIGAPGAGIQLQIVPDDDAARRMITAQQAWLATNAGWSPVPQSALHVTVVTLIDVTAAPKARDAAWAANGAAWQSAIERCTAATAPFTIHFADVRSFSPAVVLSASSCPALEDLRRRLGDAASELGRDWRAPVTAHITLARGEGVRGAAQPVSIDVAVRDLRLVHERAYPSLAVELIRTYPLA